MQALHVYIADLENSVLIAPRGAEHQQYMVFVQARESIVNTVVPMVLFLSERLCF